MKITYHVATSEDGFIATDDGGVEWLEQLEIDMAETGLAQFFADVDGLVMGRGTYDFVFDYGSWPYEDKPTWVCTSSELDVLPGANITTVSSVHEVVANANKLNLQHLWLLGGGQLASGFLEAGLLTDVCISQMPVKLNSGIPMFSAHTLAHLPTTVRRESQKRVLCEKTSF